MEGGWRGPLGSVGGITRTYGLQKRFEQPQEQRVATAFSNALLRRIAYYFKPYWKAWLLILSCIGASAGLNVLPPFCVSQILDRAIPESDAYWLSVMAGAMVGLAILSGLIGVAQQSITAKVGQGIMHDLRNALFRQLQLLSLHFYTTKRSGEIVSRITNDVGAIQNVVTGTLVTIFSNVATLLATAIALFSMNPRLALLAIIVVPAFYLPAKIVGNIRQRLSAQTQDCRATMQIFLQEHLHVGGALLTKIFGQRATEAQRFEHQSEQLSELNIRQAVVGRWLFMILSVFSAIGPALIYWYGGRAVIEAELTPGLLVAFAALLTLLYRPLIQLAGVYGDLKASLAVFERIFEYLDVQPGVADKIDAKRLPAVRGKIEFQEVCFRYPDRAFDKLGEKVEPISPSQETLAQDANPSTCAESKTPFELNALSFTIAPGERIALVGPSGAGKTTITYLVPRFYDPEAGRIALDGLDLREYEQEELRRHIGMVTQETFLFHASIRKNLLYAKPDADEAQLIAACQAANIHDFIMELPEGYHTVVGERGFRLSGGEKQRISIARALLKDPAILILDEATSSLDATSEYLIQTALEKLLQGRTSLIIAHRLSTILTADRILVLQRGQLVERGRHEDLLRQNGLYAELFRQQFGEVLTQREETEAASARSVI